MEVIFLGIILMISVLNYCKEGKARIRNRQPNKPVIYVYTRLHNSIFRTYLRQKIGRTYRLVTTKAGKDIGNEVVLVYGQLAEREEYSIKDALDGSPGERRQKILVMLKDVPLKENISKKYDPCPTNKSACIDIVRLEFLSYEDEVHKSKANSRAFKILSDALKKLTQTKFQVSRSLV